MAERYFNGAGPLSLHDIRSAGKSVTATLVGIAMRQAYGQGYGQRRSAQILLRLLDAIDRQTGD